MEFRFNALTGNLDLVEPDLRVDTVAPEDKPEGFIDVISDGSTDGIIYFFVNGHRYKLTGTLDDPVVPGVGIPMGLLLSLTYPS